MSTTNQSITRFYEHTADWQCYLWLRQEVDGAFVHPTDDPDGLNDWVFDPDLKGTFFQFRIDSRDYRSVIERIELDKAEAAFRDGFLEAAKQAVTELGFIDSSREAYGRLARRQCEAVNLRRRQHRATEAALPSIHSRHRPECIVYASGHWIEGARRRGYHHGWAFVGHAWAYRDWLLDDVDGLPNPVPDEASFPVLRDRILPKWLRAVEEWCPLPNARLSPPRPVSHSVGTQDCWSKATP